MLETNINKISKENKAQVDLKTETKGDYIKEDIKYNEIRIIYFQIKALKAQKKLKITLNYALKEDNYAKLVHKEEKNQALGFQEPMDKTILYHSNPEELRQFEYTDTERRT